MKTKAKTTETVTLDVTMTMTMSMREASALLTIMHHVGGKPGGARGVADRIGRALYDINGVYPRDLDNNGHSSGTVHFPDTWAGFEVLDRN